MEGQPRSRQILKGIKDYLMPKKAKFKKEISEEDIKTLINQGNENGLIDQTAKEMLYSIFSFDDKTAIEIMTPRATVVSVESKKSGAEILEIMMEHSFSRIPVYEEVPHNIIGVLHAKELYECALKNGVESIDVKRLIRSAYYVPETKSIATLFRELQETKNHLAIILDEYGDFQGIVTVDDIVSQVVGEIADEHQTYDEIAQIDENTYLVDGLTHIEDVNKQLGLQIECEHFDTIGGFVVNLIGWIPKQAISVSYKDIIFEVEKVKANRVEKLKIYLTGSIAV